MKPKEWTRNSRICSFSQLRPELIRAVMTEAAVYELGRVEANTSFCCETESVATKKRLFGLPGMNNKLIYTADIVTPNWYIRATNADKGGVYANFYYLKQMEVTSYKPVVIEDTGLEVVALSVGQSRRGMIFVGLGSELIAQQLKEELKKVIAKAG